MVIWYIIDLHIQEDSREQKLSDIKIRITQEILMRCSCEFTTSNITDDAFSCRGSQGQFRNTVEYRAMITLQVPASTTNADGIVSIISDWLESEPSVTVNDVVLDLDPNCPTKLDSFNSNDCVTEAPSDQTDQSSSSVGIIAGAVVAVIVVILLLITAVVIIIMYCRHKSTYSYRYKAYH